MLHFLFSSSLTRPCFVSQTAKEIAPRITLHKQDNTNYSKAKQIPRSFATMTTQDFQGRVALVTGGSKGIGRATCLALAQAGASVAINYSSDSGAADSLVKEIGADKAVAIKADAGSVKGAEQMVKETIDRFRKLDIVVANAGAPYSY